MQVLEASDELATDDSLLRLLFSMMKSSSTFDNAVSLAEELLAVKPGCFNLCSIGFMLFFLLLIKEEGICEMISNFSLRKLAFFCRVFSQLLFDPTKFTQGNNLILAVLKSQNLLRALILLIDTIILTLINLFL